MDATLGTRPTIYVVMRRRGTSQIDRFFWKILTNLMGRNMGEMLQAQQIQQKLTATPILQSGRKEFYSDLALAALMGYAQVYIEYGMPKIWGNFKCPRNVLKTTSNYWQG